jgi:hypothetical protein
MYGNGQNPDFRIGHHKPYAIRLRLPIISDCPLFSFKQEYPNSYCELPQDLWLVVVFLSALQLQS